MLRILQGIFGIFGRVKSHIIGYYDRRRRRCQRFQDFRLGIFSNLLGFASILPLEKHGFLGKIYKHRRMNSHLSFFLRVTDKNCNSRVSSSSVTAVVTPSLRKPALSTPSKSNPKNRRLNSGKYFGFLCCKNHSVT